CGARPMTLGVRLAALHCGVFLRPRDRLLETDRGAHSNALDSTGFPPASSAPPARCRTDPCSWAGRCLPKPPEARLARPNPQAPPLLRQQAPPVDALCEQGWLDYRRGGRRKSSVRESKSVSPRERRGVDNL